MGWTFKYGGPEGAPKSVLLLPGAWCTATFYDELLAAPELEAEGVRFIAATPPGFGGNPLPDGFDLSVESYAELVKAKVEELKPDVIAAHSYFANVSMQMAIDGKTSRPMVLLSPAFSLEDEESDLKLFDRLGRIPGIGWAAWAIFPSLIGPAMKSRFPKDRRKELVREMKLTPTQQNRKMVREYTEYLKGRGPLAEPLAESGVGATVVFGDNDEVGLTDAERATLEAAPNLDLVSFENAHHFLMLDQPAETLRTILSRAL